MDAGQRASSSAVAMPDGPARPRQVATAGNQAATTPALVVSVAATAPLPAARPPDAPPPITAPVRVPPPTAPRTSAAPSRARRPAAPSRRRTRRLAVGQIICWQVAIVLIALALRQPWPIVVAAAAGATALVAPTAIRVRGRWLYELALLGCRFLFRTRHHDLPKRDEAASSLLGLLLPGSTVRTIETGQGPIMAISHRYGMAAVIQPRTVTTLTASLPAPAALLPDSDRVPYRFGVQSVFHAGARPGAPAAVWLAVHVARTVQAPTDDELTLALRNGLRRVRRALGRAGVATEPLPEDAALATVARLAHITGGRNELRENWRFWRTGTVSQACFTLAGWDRLAEPDTRRLVDELLTRTPGVAVTVTLTAFTGPSGPRTDALLRLAAITEAAVDAAAKHMSPLLSSTGVHLTRLDGAHLSRVAASLPIGGFLP